MLFDRYDRPVTYMRISVTDRCNLRCTYCMPEEGVPAKSHTDMLSYEQIVRIVRVATGLGITKIRLTGGEPLVRKDIVTLVRELAALPGLEVLAMTTNGILLPRYGRALKEAGLHSVNISLDTLDEDRYRVLTRGGRLADAVAGVDAACSLGFHPIKINVVVDQEADPGDLTDLEQFCRNKGVAVQRIGRYSLSQPKTDGEEFERPPKCAFCNRLRLTADGHLKPCLHSDVEIPVDFDNIELSIRAAVDSKPVRGDVCLARPMVSIGG